MIAGRPGNAPKVCRSNMKLLSNLNIQLVRTTLKSQKPSTSFVLQGSCSFLNLPRELRDEMYRALLPSYTRLCFAAPNWNDNAAGRFFSVQCDMSPYCLTVLGLCQQMRAEANAVLYGTNHSNSQLDMGQADFRLIPFELFLSQASVISKHGPFPSAFILGSKRGI
ncbi:hypothetical protein PILCRDRAFT_505993 [Piloderma croceum F 1598]|uniref:Uncharacterized protein n=1 Tax=Piloderma croceum (strain F 1598) TaxID=765440 RepID=A0A0C3BV84_PILCF|nr:hypothetical protein PILCRDRAFT_505993 [Piloderma croceum F 1598]